MSKLLQYATSLFGRAGKRFSSCEILAKVLTPNDDSGKHGVVIPTDAYSFFPDFLIEDPRNNQTLEFTAFDCVNNRAKEIAYKYYQRYPERRITRLPSIINDHHIFRIVIFLKARGEDGTFSYVYDCGAASNGGRFDELFELAFGGGIDPKSGAFVVRSVRSDDFVADSALKELLCKFDHVNAMGWVDSMRSGDTGIGYTFESLIGIKENNDQKADFQGIEIKCKGLKEGGASSSEKINLFQAGPVWLKERSARELIRVLGKVDVDGFFKCYSQVTVLPNNLDLQLEILQDKSRIDLRKLSDTLGYWAFKKLEERLAEKHSRAAFVKARVKSTKTGTRYCYEELVYFEQPSIDRFVDLVADRSIVFEFTLSEKPGGTIRNHGYPWRLIRAEFLDALFSFQIKLR